MWPLFGIVLWYPSLADDVTLLNIFGGHHVTMVTRGKGMRVFLLTNHSISLVKSTMADMMWEIILLFYVLYALFLSSWEGVSVYSDTRWGSQIHDCFTSELGEILSYNGFSAGGIDHPRVRSIVWKKVAFRLLVS